MFVRQMCATEHKLHERNKIRVLCCDYPERALLVFFFFHSVSYDCKLQFLRLFANQYGDTHRQEQCANRDVSLTNEHVLATIGTQCGDQQRLLTIEGVHFEIGHDIDGQAITSLEIARGVDLGVDFAEGGEHGGAHPDDEVWIRHAFQRTNLLWVCLIQVLCGIIVGVAEFVRQSG